MSLLQTLTQAGYKVRSVDGGHAALFEIDHETPDLPVCDLNMPGLSGFELLTSQDIEPGSELACSADKSSVPKKRDGA
jgi:CheY-like chemotaxis protein